MMERVSKLVLLPETNPFQMDYLQRKQECAIYADLIIARHKEQQACYMDDQASQVLSGITMASEPPVALNEFISNIEARVFANTLSAPPQELNREYGLPKKGSLISKQSFCQECVANTRQSSCYYT